MARRLSGPQQDRQMTQIGGFHSGAATNRTGAPSGSLLQVAFRLLALCD